MILVVKSDYLKNTRIEWVLAAY